MGGIYFGVPGEEIKLLDSPYNTFTNEGLPPSAICNPGKHTLVAALNPSDSSYKYFITLQNGNVIFAKTEIIMAKCIIFIRVSTESQEFISQREELYRTAHNHGYADQDIIEISKKESGKKLSESEREGLTELYQYFEKGGVSDVYIWELSRLSRRQKDIFAIIEKFKDYRVQLHCLNPSFVLLNREKTDIELSARLAIGIFGAMAEQEVIEKKARFARGKKIKAEQNKYNGGAIPYGYRVDKEQDNLIVPDEVESEVVREIFRLYEKGYSQAKIARELDSRGAKGRSVASIFRTARSLVES
jgi:DNA invertase Pin-like site-specific DNA recombinase